MNPKTKKKNEKKIVLKISNHKESRNLNLNYLILIKLNLCYKLSENLAIEFHVVLITNITKLQSRSQHPRQSTQSLVLFHSKFQ